MNNRRKKLNKKFTFAFLFILFISGCLFYVDFVKQSNDILPIMTKTQEELYDDYIEIEETSAHTAPPSDDVLPPLPDKDPGEKVSFNVSSLKYHKINCEWAQKCTNCIIISKKEAISRGGKPCNSCL